MKMLLLVREIITLHVCPIIFFRILRKKALLRSTFLFSNVNIYFVAEILKNTIVL